jgi:hypothetical protein
MIRLVLALVLATGCSTGELGAACARHSDCAAGLACGAEGTCGIALDAGPGDAVDDSGAIPPLPIDASTDIDAPDDL